MRTVDMDWVLWRRRGGESGMAGLFEKVANS